MLIDHAFLERNNSIIRDRDAFGTNLCAAFGDVTIADAREVVEIFGPILGVERVHFEGRRVNKKSRPDKFLMLFMIPEDVAHILAQKTLDTLAKLLHAVYVLLLHSPGAVLCIGWPGL